MAIPTDEYMNNEKQLVVFLLMQKLIMKKMNLKKI